MFDPKKAEEIRLKFPDVVFLEAADEVVGVRSPSRAQYNRYREMLMNDSRRSGANQTLLADCLVWPEAVADREGVFDRRPALVDTFANELVRMAGGGVEAKKF